jgi:hypothetical protein
MITVTRINNKLFVKSPYNPALPKRARAIGGDWDKTNSVWVFDMCDEELVRGVYTDIYSEWENDNTVRARITLTGQLKSDDNAAVYICGVEIARASGRDSGAKISPRVRWVSGDLPGSGGSAKYWRTYVNAPAIFDIVDFPEAALDKLGSQATESGFSFEILQGQLPNLDALRAERGRLTGRIAEIDALLQQQQT